MPDMTLSHTDLYAPLNARLGAAVRQNEALGRYTTLNVGGPAEFFIAVDSEALLAEAVQAAWALDLPYWILGAGSNVLIAESGLPGLVILNRARELHFEASAEYIRVRASSGLMLPTLARRCITRGAGGLEWAATVPGTVGGAIVGNAGAHGSDMAANTRLVTFLHQENGMQTTPYAELQPTYRSTWFKQHPGVAVVLAAEFQLTPADPAELQARVDQFTTHRKSTQPGGASTGSMFKNPPGDYAGRLIEAAGLKGTQIGGAQISEIHANFFVNRGSASPADFYNLITLARQKVQKLTGVKLELEVELLGNWLAL